MTTSFVPMTVAAAVGSDPSCWFTLCSVRECGTSGVSAPAFSSASSRTVVNVTVHM